jgi:hypothetical protein
MLDPDPDYQYRSETLLSGFATSGSTEVTKTQRILNQLETALFFLCLTAQTCLKDGCQCVVLNI